MSDIKLAVSMNVNVFVCPVGDRSCIQGVSLPMAQNSGKDQASLRPNIEQAVLRMDGLLSNLKVVVDTFFIMSKAMCPISCHIVEGG